MKIDVPGATPEEVAAILAVLSAARATATASLAGGREPMPAWRRAARREATGAAS
jgi:hypothetical protein